MRSIAITLALLAANTAQAHVVLEKREAAVGSYYKAVFQVGHGCDGKATTAVSVEIPDGVIAAKPMPKPGWTLDLVKRAYAQTHSHHGHAISEGTRGMIWTGNLPYAFYDEFVVLMMLTDALKPGTTLYFPVVQTCGDTEVRWDVIPDAGRDRPQTPAPGLLLIPKG